MKKKFIKSLHLVLVFSLLLTLPGCFYWWRAYQTYLQMDEFDEHFSVSADENFIVHFKDPILLSEDFVRLAKLRPSTEEKTAFGKVWHYQFRKVDKQGNILLPEVMFSFDLTFNQDDRIIDWSFSRLFLQIAPPEFLELSFRSLGGAEINPDKKQLKVNTEKVKKIHVPLPLKSSILAHLGKPLEIEDEADQEIYVYHFKLEAYDIEEGYEDRALSVLKLTFDKTTQEMIKMSGRFAGLKISINYRKYQEQQHKKPTPV